MARASTVKYASLGRRIIAFLIDIIILAVATAVVGLVTALLAGETPAAFVSQTFLFVAMFAYFIYFEGKTGQTPGKRVVNITVQTVDGEPIDYKASALRNILRIVDALPTFYIVGIIAILLTDRDQRVGDLAANTVVIDTRT